MKKSYIDKSILEIDKELSKQPPKISLTGENLTVAEIVSVSRGSTPVVFSPSQKIKKHIKDSYEQMMKNVRDGIPVYGCNTAYGGRAGRVLNGGSPKERVNLARKISEGIAHVDVSVGPEFERDVVRGAMLIRINAIMQGVSAVKIEDLEIYRQMLNKGITPIVNQYGGIGASGDLAHNSRIVSAARQLEGTMVYDSHGRKRPAKQVLTEENIPRLILDPKAGLGLVNGDNFSTALAALLAVDTINSLIIASIAGAMAIEVIKGTDRSFHPFLAELRPHPGQREVASIYRYLLSDSKLAFQEMKGHKPRDNGIKVQDAYSLRCISQYHGPNFEKIKQILDTVTTNANSVSDNPLWVSPEHTTKGEDPWQWVSGGNFLAMYMVEAMDSLRKILTQIIKLNDRHLARIVNPHENNGLTANLSDPKGVTQCTFKGIQIQSGMFEVYSSLLSIPVSTFFGVHEEGNQDVTAHSLTSGILGLENLRLTRYSLAQNLLAVCQGVNLRGGPKFLSPKTRPIYEFIRQKADYTIEEKPLYTEVEEIYQSITSGELSKFLREKVFT